jgi:hypothetical protein
MNRLGNTTAQLLRRRALAAPGPPAVQTYRDQPGHLADAGGAYLVLPYGLLHTLNGDRQQHLVDILTELATTDPRWASTTTYPVLPWARVRPRELSDEELTWHGITSDIDPASGAVAYSRGAAALHPDTIVGHRPAPDPIPAPPGTYPGARPALLPAGPGQNTPGSPPWATSTGLRTERAKRMIETHRRRGLVARHAPTADAQWAQAITAADPLWGPDEDWKLLIDQTTTAAAIPAPPAVDDPFQDEAAAELLPPTAPQDTETVNPGPHDDDAELVALEADLQDLYRP